MKNQRQRTDFPYQNTKVILGLSIHLQVDYLHGRFVTPKEP